MSEILILGLPGSVKTTLVQELVNRGQNALDADAVPGLGGWYDTHGNRLSDPAPGAAHAQTDVHLWDEEAMRKIISTPRRGDLYVAGIAHNFPVAIPLFGRLVYLAVGEEALLEHMAGRAVVNPRSFGADPEEARRICQFLPAFEDALRSLGALTVNGERPTSEIAADVMAIAQQRQTDHTPLLSHA